MKQIAITNEKALVAGISKAFNKMEAAKKGYVHSVIELGERLIEAKEKVGHGGWSAFLNRNSELRFGSTEQARKIMIVAENKSLVLEFFNDENSINGLTKAITDASPEQIEKAKQLKIEQEQKRLADEQARAEKAASKKQPEIIEGEFTEVKPNPKKPEPKPEEVKPGMVQIEAEKLEEMEDGLHELASLNNTISKDNASMAKVFDANDQLAAAVKEIKRLNDLNTSLEGRLNGFMTERNALIKEAKYWRARFEKLEKANVQ